MLKILIAEDDRELRQLFSYVLTKNGYAVKGVSNGKEALDAMDNDYFDLVITDIMMPAILIILIVHIIIAIRWMLIKILSAVINDWERSR